MKPKRHLSVLPEGFVDPKLPQGTFSASQYGLYKKCPKAYEFSYVLGIKNPPNGAMLTGTSIHAGAEAAHLLLMDKKNPDSEEMSALVSDRFEAEKDDVVSWDEGVTAGSAKDRAVQGYRAYHLNGLPTVKPISAEQVFVKKIGTVPMVGYIDLIDAPEPGRLVVADMKTGASAWSQDDVDKDPQFTLYSVVTGILDVRVDNVSFLKKGPEFSQKTATRDSMSHRNYLEDLEEVSEDVKAGRFPKTSIDSWACSAKWCGYWRLCRGRSL